uniref:Uncharacterized protein n=1 Tax=Parascaris univalens TaxID=6257 RepID=A0A915C3M9_PARUN
MKAKSGSDPEEVTDIIQEIIKNLRLVQLRSSSANSEHEIFNPTMLQTETGHKKLGPNLPSNARPKRATTNEFLENPAPAQGSDSPAREHDLYDDDIVISEKKYTVTESQATTLAPNSAVSNEPDIAWSNDKENDMHATATKERRLKQSEPLERVEHMDEEKPGWTNNCNDETLKRIIEDVDVSNFTSRSEESDDENDEETLSL